MTLTTHSEAQMIQLGRSFGQVLRGGECIELIGDVGAGKTTFTKGLAQGLGVNDDVQSPSFTLSRTYQARAGLELHHYDFYRLNDPGIMAMELNESVSDPNCVTVVEWADNVQNVLPVKRIVLKISCSPDGQSRNIQVSLPSQNDYLQQVIQND